VQTGLAGKVVIVTAATANTGRGIALAFAAGGARVVIAGRAPVAGELVARLARAQAAADALWHFTMIELGPPAFVDAAARAGFDAVSLMVQFPATRGPGFPVLGDTAMRRETISRLDGTGLVLFGASTCRIEPGSEAGNFLQALETAACLDARSVNGNGNDPDPARLCDRFAALCDLAARYGIGCGLESMMSTEVDPRRRARADRAFRRGQRRGHGRRPAPGPFGRIARGHRRARRRADLLRPAVRRARRRAARGLRLGDGHRADAARRGGTAAARPRRRGPFRRAAGGRGAVAAAAGRRPPGRCLRGPGDGLAHPPAGRRETVNQRRLA